MRGSCKVTIDFEIPESVKVVLEKNQEAVAKMIADDARSTTSFSDKTGKLRKGIQHEFREDRWIARARAPHAHLVEFGHGGPHAAPAHPFLRPAKERVISQIR